MGSRFVLLLVLARVLPPAELGLFGLFLAAIAFGVLVLGADYYTYSQRELLSEPRQRWSFVLQHQGIALAVIYLLVVAPLALAFDFELLPNRYVAWFIPLLVLEHLGQEFVRILIAMRRPIGASAMLFLRVGAWVWVLLAVMWFAPETRTLEAVLLAWGIGAGSALIGGALIVAKEAAPWRGWPVDLAWLIKGFRIAGLYLVASLCFKALLTADRYLVDFLVGPDLLGVYVLYSGIAMAVVNFMDPAVFAFLYPRLVGAYRTGDLASYRKVRTELWWSTAGVSLGLAILIGLAAPTFLHWTGREIYLVHEPLLWLLLGVAVVYSMGMVPHYELYARGADRSIVIAHVSALIVFGFCVAFLSKYMPLEATAFGLLCAFTWMGLAKLWNQHQYRRTEPREMERLAGASPIDE